MVTEPSRVTLPRWWWLNPWKQVRILQGNLDACRWAAERFQAWKQPPQEFATLDIGHQSGPDQHAALLTALGAANPEEKRYTRIHSGLRTIAWIVPP